jgi:hypothetical protein
MDFGTPEILSDKQKTLFAQLHAVYLKTFESILQVMFSSKISMNIIKCEDVKYHDFLPEANGFSFVLEEIFISHLKSYKIIASFDRIFYSMILDKVLGGKAVKINKVDKITEIEEALLVKQFDGIFHKLFQNTANKSLLVSSFLEASALCDDISDNGIAVNINIVTNNVITSMNIFYPAKFIQGVIFSKN